MVERGLPGRESRGLGRKRGRSGGEEGTDPRAASSNGKPSAARAQPAGLPCFFPGWERRRAGIDLSSLPISLKFQINKIHFSAPLPSPPQQTKEKQFPAVCSKLLAPSLGALRPFSPFRGSVTAVSRSPVAPRPQIRAQGTPESQLPRTPRDSAASQSQKVAQHRNPTASSGHVQPPCSRTPQVHAGGAPRQPPRQSPQPRGSGSLRRQAEWF